MSADLPPVRPGTGVIPARTTTVRARVAGAPGASMAMGSTTAERSGAAGSLLEGSGVDLRQLLLDGDRLLERTPQSRVELTTRLEAARGALVQNHPSEVLALLDESWEAAQHTEQGWYLRGSALAALGLPGEALRVAQEALRIRPRSRALQFLGSLARLLVGDNPGARALVEQALAEAPDDPLLLAHHAVIASRSGHRDTANQLLQQASVRFPEHPAVQYARAWIASDRATASRSAARGATSATECGIDQGPAVTAPTTSHAHRVLSESSYARRAVDYQADWDAWSEVERRDANVDARPAQGADTSRVAAPTNANAGSGALADDAIDSMFRDIGRTLRTQHAPEAISNEARRLLRALASGGALGLSAGPERMHAARTLLSTIHTVWNGGDYPVMQDSNGEPRSTGRFDARTVLVPLFELVRSGKHDVATRSMQHTAMQLPISMRRLLVVMFEEHTPQVSARRSGSHAALDGASALVQTDRARDEASRGVISPIRLGLALIEENSAAAAASANVVQRAYSTTAGMRAIPDILELQARGAAPRYATGPAGWEALPSHSQSSRTARVVAVICVFGAIGAMAAGKAVVALALAGGASWFALRRAHRLHDTAEYRTAERSIRDASR